MVPCVGKPQQARCVEFFGNNGIARIGSQLRCREILQQDRVADRQWCWSHCLTEPDVNLQRDARTIQRCLQVDPHAAIACLLADDRPLD